MTELGHHDGDESRPEHEWFIEGNLRSLVKRLKERVGAIEERSFKFRDRETRVLIIPLDWDEDEDEE